MAELIWSIIAVAGALVVIGAIVWFLFEGRNDRADEEAAREFFDEHGHWPDEAPTSSR